MRYENYDGLDKTISYYDVNATQYFLSSIDIDMSHLYAPFLKELPCKAKILDAGCGSGRDTKYFIENGHYVTAFDASLSLARLASRYTRVKVEHNTFEKINYSDDFDAVWACASLLHLDSGKLRLAFNKLEKTCKNNGVIYASFKMAMERSNDDREFHLYKIEDIKSIIKLLPNLSVIKYWYTEDALNRSSTKWLNVFLKVQKS